VLVPLADRPARSAARPWATWALATGLVLAYLAGTGWGGWFEGLGDQALRWGLVPSAPRPPSLVTHLFVHASPWHLVGNLLLLLVFGPNVERCLGRLALLGAFLLCGAAGAVAFRLAAPEGEVPLVGASGAALGLGALHAVALRGQRVLVFVWVLVVWVGELPARVLILVLLALDLLAVWSTGFAGGRVAVPAHLGGLAVGALIGLLGRRAVPRS
jgi:membrane associated rhomboid family serine protease